MNNTENLETAAPVAATNAIGDIVEAEWISAEDWKNGKRWAAEEAATNEVGAAVSREPATIAAVENADPATGEVAPTKTLKLPTLLG